MPIKSEFINLSIQDGSSMQAFIAYPDNQNGNTSAIIVFQEAFGVNSHIRNIAMRLADEGYIAIAPELFHRTAPVGFEAGYTDWSIIEPHFMAINFDNFKLDALACWDWLQNDLSVDINKIASIGFCMGGRVSLQANSFLPLKAAISYYGGRIAPEIERFAPLLHAPMLFFWGGLDKHILPEHIQKIISELKKEEKQFINVEISYADHGFNCDEREAYNPQAAKEAWAMTLAFLKEKLI